MRFRSSKPSGERLLEDGLTKTGGTLEVSGHRCFQLPHHAQSPLHFRHDPGLLGEGWERNCHPLQYVQIDVLLRGRGRELRKLFLCGANEELNVTCCGWIAVVS